MGKIGQKLIRYLVVSEHYVSLASIYRFERLVHVVMSFAYFAVYWWEWDHFDYSMFEHVFRLDWLLIGLLGFVGMALDSQQLNEHLQDCLAGNWMRDGNDLNAVAMDAVIAKLSNVLVSVSHFQYWPFERNGCRHEPLTIYHRVGVNIKDSDGSHCCRTWNSPDLYNSIHCLS